jgi:hypothetical protein
MARNKKPADAAKDKAAKQKKIAIGLVCFLALAIAYAAHTMMALGGGGTASKPQAADPATATTTTPAATDTTAAAATAAPTLAGAPADPAATATPPAGSSELVSAVSPPADPGQLESFSRFETKDPFAGGGPKAPIATGTSGTSGSGSGSSGSGSSSPPAVPPAPPNPPPTSALISVNGSSEQVSTNGIFPVSSPSSAANGLFELVSLTAKTAKVAVVGGSYASGSQTLTLTVNEPVTLVNTADGTRYTLVLYPQGTPAPVAGATGSIGSSPPPVATTPAATTPTTTTPSSGG